MNEVSATADPTRPLGHVRVLDLTRMIPGAYCTLMLADLGADVLKVEGPGAGDGLRFMSMGPVPAAHVALNRGKRSLRLDLKNPRAADVLRRLARNVDVIVESQRPGMLDSLGLGFDDLRADHPGLVWCSLTGFGPDGPNVHAPGHDMTYLGYAGVLDALTVDGVPPVPNTVLSLPITGLMGAFGIVAALTGRDRTGVGSRVDANMVDSAIWMMAEQLTAAAGGPVPAWGSMAARSNYRCADGRWVTCTTTEPRSWAALVEALDLPELAGHTFGTGEPATRERLAAVFATRPQADWLARPGMAGGIGPVNEVADLLDDPQLAHREAMVPVGDGGPLVLVNPLRIDRAVGASGSHALTPPPDLGEHTDVALGDAGFTAGEIAELREAGAV